MSERPRVPLWGIPMVYTLASVLAGAILPRLEQFYFPSYTHGMSTGSALAFFSAVGSGMMALTGIVFAIAFVVVQFSSLAYSPRLVALFTGNATLFHTLGIFFATFIYSLVALIWTDRGATGRVPLFSSVLVMVLLVISMLAFARLIQSINDLQINKVLQFIGTRGRTVIGSVFPHLTADEDSGMRAEVDDAVGSKQMTQTLTYSGEPRVIARFDIAAMVRLAEGADAVITAECGTGDTVVEDAVLLRVHGAKRDIPERSLLQTIRLASVRTFEQDPKYAIRLLVDIAIRALSPAINDPTTAVQAIDQIEDLLRRLGRRQLDANHARDGHGTVRLIFPVPTWQDYLSLAFDEIRQYGAISVQVMRRLQSALKGLAETVATAERRNAVRRYLEHLNVDILRSSLDDQDKEAALEEDRQGLGLSRKRAESQEAAVRASRQ